MCRESAHATRDPPVKGRGLTSPRQGVESRVGTGTARYLRSAGAAEHREPELDRD